MRQEDNITLDSRLGGMRPVIFLQPPRGEGAVQPPRLGDDILIFYCIFNVNLRFAYVYTPSPKKHVSIPPLHHFKFLEITLDETGRQS